MNKERILTLADILENRTYRDIGFNMADAFSAEHSDTYFRPKEQTACKTVGCMAGVACITFDPENVEKDEKGFLIYRGQANYNGMESQTEFMNIARDLLDLTPLEARHLFYPPDALDWNRITPEEAATVLRNLAETGVVQWPYDEHDEDAD